MEADDKTMLVRLQGGDIQRRPVASEDIYRPMNGGPDRLVRQIPELRDGEELTWPMADSMPTIIRS